jgi:hypothetical protein
MGSSIFILFSEMRLRPGYRILEDVVVRSHLVVSKSDHDYAGPSV